MCEHKKKVSKLHNFRVLREFPEANFDVNSFNVSCGQAMVCSGNLWDVIWVRLDWIWEISAVSKCLCTLLESKKGKEKNKIEEKQQEEKGKTLWKIH